MEKPDKYRRQLPGLRLRIVLHFILITMASLVLISLVAVRLSRQMLQERERQVVSLAGQAARLELEGEEAGPGLAINRTQLPNLFNIGLLSHYGIYCAGEAPRQSSGQAPRQGSGQAGEMRLIWGAGEAPRQGSGQAPRLESSGQLANGFIGPFPSLSKTENWIEQEQKIRLLRIIPRSVGMNYFGRLKAGCWLVLQQDFSRVERGITQIKFWLAGYVLSFALIMAGLGYLLISRVVAPLEEVAEVAGRIAEGEHDRRLEVQATDELNELANAFNVMTQRLVEQQRDLQKRYSELSRLHEELRQAQNEIVQKEKLASVGRLAAGLAHEIGNPLAAVMGYLEIVKREAGQSTEVAGYNQKIDHELGRIEKLIRQLLSYSHPGIGSEMRADLEPVLRDSLKNLEARGLLAGKEVSQRNIGPTRVAINSEQLRQVLINLLQNAAQSISGEGRIEIELFGADQAKPKPDWHIQPKKPLSDCALLRITDSGSGIEEENLGQIFDPFFTTKDPGQGTGLGLYLAVNVIKEAGGGIRVSSQPNQGSQFEVALPIASNDR